VEKVKRGQRVRLPPVTASGGLGLLRCFYVEFARADVGLQSVFELVFDMSVPWCGLVGLGPEVPDRVGASEFEADTEPH